MKLYTVSIFWLMVAIQWPDVEAECCTGGMRNTFVCRTFCCGCGPCNIFCCNCADGCNRSWWKYEERHGGVDRSSHRLRCGHKKKRSIDSYYSYSKAQQLFNEVDADGSQNITIDEADQYLKNQSQYKRDTSFSLIDEIEKMDENKDGIISPFEFDNSLHF